MIIIEMHVCDNERLNDVVIGRSGTRICIPNGGNWICMIGEIEHLKPGDSMRFRGDIDRVVIGDGIDESAHVCAWANA